MSMIGGWGSSKGSGLQNLAEMVRGGFGGGMGVGAPQMPPAFGSLFADPGSAGIGRINAFASDFTPGQAGSGQAFSPGVSGWGGSANTPWPSFGGGGGVRWADLQPGRQQDLIQRFGSLDQAKRFVNEGNVSSGKGWV